ncbi:MAG: RNA 2',3'-cyclic phosphodiesterase [Oscillospiraceae bacterium]|jgi:2'-5' RNA ligase|nr:RNA 2',3'-cyclic phosphodiesterase [Oscillospiraceae bacterium]
MRLFVAINFNDNTRGGLLALRDELKAKSPRGHFSLPENLHLTLAFLGECDKKQLVAAKSAMNAVNFEPFDVTIERIGNFRGDLWWAGCRATPQLSAIQQALSDNLRKAGFMLENRKYSPHITLGREVITDVTPWTIKPFGETVGKLDLMKSERIGGKLTYTAICTTAT